MPLSGRANVKLGESHRCELGDWAPVAMEICQNSLHLFPSPNRYLGIGFAFRVTGCHFQGKAKVASEPMADLFGLEENHWGWGRGTERRGERWPCDFLRDPDFLTQKNSYK